MVETRNYISILFGARADIFIRMYYTHVYPTSAARVGIIL